MSVTPSRFVPDTKYQDSAGLCSNCGKPLEALKHDPPLTPRYSMSAYVLFCGLPDGCLSIFPNIRRWNEWETT